MHSKSDNIEFMIYDNADKITEEHLDCVHLLYYKCHEINRDRGGPYTDPPDWIKSKKSNNKSYQ